MADLSKQEVTAAEHMAAPPENEAEILKGGTEKNAKPVSQERKEERLPPLSAADFKIYNRMAEHMDYFHNHFRQTWNTLYNACLSGRRPSNLSLGQFISMGTQFLSHLEAHHSIEERHVFPMLARKMPEFKAGKDAAELLRQHREIHKGMDVMGEYLQRCRSGEADFELGVLKQKMESWGGVLWTHLDEEVRTLGAENMRKYWTLEEMRRMPM